MGMRPFATRLLKSFNMNSFQGTARYTNGAQITENSSRQFEEVQIRCPWGHISGKWYGPRNTRPIVGMHGWQDNAGTFDTLAPLLPSHIGFLSLDLPGHGLSSRMPEGCFYNAVDNLHIIRLIMKEYKWDKISFLAHSMSSIIGFMFASIYPDKVDMLIGLDALKPHVRPINKLLNLIGSRMESFMIADGRNRDKSEPPSYTYDELIEKLHTGTFTSISKESCPHLLARNIQKSSKYPDKYFFTRDNRLKSYNFMIIPQEVSIEMAKNISCPYLFIKATNSSYYEDKKYFDEVIDVLKQKPNFEFHQVEGTHHVHLNEPRKISNIINPFICKNRQPEAERQLQEIN